MNILIVEDDDTIREQLCITLNRAGYSADGVGSMAAFNAWCQTHRYDLLIADRQLPDGDGLEIARLNKINHQAPVIVLTGLTGPSNRLQGLQANVDLYIEKPTSPAELLEAVAYLQRNQNQAPEIQSSWVIKTQARLLISPCAKEFPLTAREQQLLLLLAREAGTILSRQTIADELGFGQDPGYSKRLEVSIRRLRNKIHEQLSEFPLTTIYGTGLTFNESIAVSKS